MRLGRTVAVVGSRKFTNYAFLDKTLKSSLKEGDIIVSGGAVGVDSMAQRWAKENGFSILIYYPDYNRYGRGATFTRNKWIAEEADEILAFYAKGFFGEGGTANTVDWGRKLGKKVLEFEEP